MLLPAKAPLLITSCIVPIAKLGKLEDPGLRLRYTLEGLENWLLIDPNLNIVLCDGSDFDFQPIIRRKFPRSNIECLRFQNTTAAVSQHGKGYGEGEIIKYALAHSELLAACNVFIKCTAKLWVSNFSGCLNEWNGRFAANAHFKNVLSLKEHSLEYIDTRFYITDKAFFLENLLDLHFKTGLTSHSSIEFLFLKKILDLNLKHYIFNQSPTIRGVGGGSNSYYKNNFRRHLKDILRKKILRRDAQFKNLFYPQKK